MNWSSLLVAACSPPASPLAVTSATRLIWERAADTRVVNLSGSLAKIVTASPQHLRLWFIGRASTLSGAEGQRTPACFQVSYYPFTHHELGARGVQLMFQSESQKSAWQFKQISYSCTGSVWPSPKAANMGTRLRSIYVFRLYSITLWTFARAQPGF